jgi:hypothetical protein
MFKLNKIAGSVIAVTAILGSAGVALADGYAPKGKKVVYERPTNWRALNCNFNIAPNLQIWLDAPSGARLVCSVSAFSACTCYTSVFHLIVGALRSISEM